MTWNRFLAMLKDDRGAVLVEYSLALALLTTAGIAATVLMIKTLSSIYAGDSARLQTGAQYGSRDLGTYTTY